MASQTTLCKVYFLRKRSNNADTLYRACSLTDSYLLKYPNAYSIAVPAINEVGYFSRITQEVVRKKLVGLSYAPEGK
jgi:hypothetical protein